MFSECTGLEDCFKRACCFNGIGVDKLGCESVQKGCLF